MAAIHKNAKNNKYNSFIIFHPQPECLKLFISRNKNKRLNVLLPISGLPGHKPQLPYNSVWHDSFFRWLLCRRFLRHFFRIQNKDNIFLHYGCAWFPHVLGKRQTFYLLGNGSFGSYDNGYCFFLYKQFHPYVLCRLRLLHNFSRLCRSMPAFCSGMYVAREVALIWGREDEFHNPAPGRWFLHLLIPVNEPSAYSARFLCLYEVKLVFLHILGPFQIPGIL